MPPFRPRPPSSPLGVLLLVLPALIAALLPAAARAEEIVLGMSAVFKGPSRGLGIELYRGSMAYFEHINQGQGVHGRKIVIKAYNDSYNPLPALENTERLIEQDEVFLLYGYVGTPTVTRVLPLLKQYNDRSVSLFFPFTGALPQRQPPYDAQVFNLRASYHQETAGLVKNFVRIGRKRIAMFYQIDSYGRGGWDGVRAELARDNLKIVAEATYARGGTFEQSYRAQVEWLQKAQPDAVICVGAYAACAGFIRDARDAGLDVPITNVSFVGSENLLGLLVQASKAGKKDYTLNLINTQVVPTYHRRELAAVRQYEELMDRYQPQPPAHLVDKDYQVLPRSFVSFEGFLNAKLLVEILTRMGPRLDRSRLRGVVESIDQLDLGIDVPVSFGPGRHQGMDQVYYTTVEAGRFEPIVDWQRWRR